MRLLVLVPFLALALAQVPVGVNLPEGTSLSLSAEEVLFDLTQSAYPLGNLWSRTFVPRLTSRINRSIRLVLRR